MSATHALESTVPQGPVLYMAIELSLATWKLAFTVGSGQETEDPFDPGRRAAGSA